MTGNMATTLESREFAVSLAGLGRDCFRTATRNRYRFVGRISIDNALVFTNIASTHEWSLTGSDRRTRFASRFCPRRLSPVVQVVQLESPLERLSDCRTVPYLRFFLVRNEEAGGSNPISSTKITIYPNASATGCETAKTGLRYSPRLTGQLLFHRKRGSSLWDFCGSRLWPRDVSSRTMAKKRRSQRPELLSRNLEFSSHRVSVHLHAVHHKGVEPYIESKPWLELKGTANEPVRDVKDVVVSLYPEDKPVVGTARPAACGAIVGTRPKLKFRSSCP